MALEILRGPDSFDPERLFSADRKPVEHISRHPVARSNTMLQPDVGSIPESRPGYSEIYSNKHERLLLRSDHIARMDAIRKSFNESRIHPGQRALTTSDIVTSALDFAMQHRIPFYELAEADDLPRFMAEHIYRDVLSRWRQWNELF